jgi:hypothetical protein
MSTQHHTPTPCVRGDFTGFRPEQRGSWGITYYKAFRRDGAHHIIFANRDDADGWVRAHNERLERIASRLERVARQRRAEGRGKS